MFWLSAASVAFITCSHGVPPRGSQWNHTVSWSQVTEPHVEPSRWDQRSGEGDPEGRSSQEVRYFYCSSFINNRSSFLKGFFSSFDVRWNVLDGSFRRSLLTRSLALFSLLPIIVVFAEKCCMPTVSMPTKPVAGILGQAGHMLAANGVHHPRWCRSKRSGVNPLHTHTHTHRCCLVWRTSCSKCRLEQFLLAPPTCSSPEPWLDH